MSVVHAAYKKDIIARAKRVIVKLGSNVVTTRSGVHAERVGRIVAEIARIQEEGYEVVVVTSGARAAGLARLRMGTIPERIPEQQAAAAIGQITLMAMYERFFSDHGKHVGQVLLTATGLRDRSQYLNAKHTLSHLLKHGIIPVVNENDSVAIDELKFGDNDKLSALVAGLAEADLLILLTDVDGLYESDPRAGDAELIPVVDKIDSTLLDAGGGAGRVGTGGMRSKLIAAEGASRRGIPTIIANGVTPGTLSRVMSGEESVGTLFLPSASRISSREHWVAYGLPVTGALVIDEGARRALLASGASLLPVGVTEVRGDFAAGDCVRCLGPDGAELARGLVVYDSVACGRIRGRASSEINDILGYRVSDEIIHRDDLVLLTDVGASGGG